jgi:hypothetical protein
MATLPIKNDCTREGFAEFLRRLAANKVGEIEWQRFMVTHYHDELIEAARVAIVQRSIERDPGMQWSESDLAAMQHWSHRLHGEEN